VGKAKRQGRLVALVNGAHKANPTNPDLAALHADVQAFLKEFEVDTPF